jgi:hypothetical protein
MKIYFTTLGITLMVSFLSVAQTPPSGKVSGRVLDEKQEAFPFVNILLLNVKDSTLYKGVQSDENGRYSFEQVAANNYLILVSTVGYSKKYSPAFEVQDKSIQQSDIELTLELNELNEVKVVAKRPFIEQEIDRTIINVENSIVSAGSTALQVLERSPGITIDQQNDRIQLRGKEGVIVQIDGKQTYLSQSELMTLLKNTPSDNIEKIELITNPSAKYDAVGTAGIINIKFKKNQNLGTNGNLSLSGGLADRSKPRGNGSLSLNHRKEKFNAFLTGSTYRSKGFNKTDLYRKVPYNNDLTIFDQFTDRLWTGSNTNLRAGADYFLSKKTTIGMLVSGFVNKWEVTKGITTTDILNQDLTPRESYNTHTATQVRMKNYTANLNLKHQFNDKGKELSVDADYARYDGRSANQLTTSYFNPDGSPKSPTEFVRNHMPSEISIGAAKLDYAQPLWNGKFEGGLKSSVVASDNIMRFETKADDWTIDSKRSNQFKYDENINAAYLNYSGKINSKTSYQVGVRAEQTHSKGNSITLDQLTDRKYLDLFPSLFLSRNLDSSNVLNLSYSRRIDRPNYQSLNPFEYYLDPYTYQKGNPNLRPQYTHSFQLTHVYKNFLNTSIGYSRVTDMISQEVPGQDAEKNILYVTTENLDNQDNATITVSAPIPVKKWWNLQINAGAVYNRYQSFYLDAFYDVVQFSWNGYVNNQFTLPKEWSVELSGWYNSRSVYGFTIARPQGMINIGVQKTVMDKKGTIRMNVNDLFAMNKFRGHSKFQDIDYVVNARWPSRQINVSFSYRFGNQNIKSSRQRNTGVDDIEKRINQQ